MYCAPPVIGELSSPSGHEQHPRLRTLRYDLRCTSVSSGSVRCSPGGVSAILAAGEEGRGMSMSGSGMVLLQIYNGNIAEVTL